MRRFLAASAAAAALAACAREQRFSAPAPEGALDCALVQAEDLGYRRMAGEREEGYIRVSQRLEPTTADRDDPGAILGPDRVRPIYEDQHIENQLVFRHQDGRLHVQVLAVDENGRMVRAGSSAEAHAQVILSACTT